MQATEMSLRAFDKSGSGRRTANVSCENTNRARGSSNFCCRRLELCFVFAVNKYGSAMRNQTLGCFFSYARAASRDNRYFILELHKSLLYAFFNMISSSQGEDTVGKKLVATPPSPGRPPFCAFTFSFVAEQGIELHPRHVGLGDVRHVTTSALAHRRFRDRCCIGHGMMSEI
jgi:hypothetical protein